MEKRGHGFVLFQPFDVWMHPLFSWMKKWMDEVGFPKQVPIINKSRRLDMIVVFENNYKIKKIITYNKLICYSLTFIL